MKTLRRHNFTVLELLSVIVVAAVLLSMAIPAFSHLKNGKAPGFAARELMSKISLARAYAAAHRTYVGIVFPMESTVTSNFRYTSYRVCELSSEKKFVKWLDQWNHLPHGIVFGTTFKQPGATEKNAGSNRTGTQTISVKIPSGADESDVSVVTTIIFTPSGLLLNNEGVRIPLQEGTVENGTYTLLSGKSTYCYPLIVRITGKTRFYDELISL